MVILGVTKQLSYVRALGADAVILSPVVTRSTDCAKPGALHFSDFDQRYGSLEDFNGLLDKAKKLGVFDSLLHCFILFTSHVLYLKLALQIGVQSGILKRLIVCSVATKKIKSLSFSYSIYTN